MKPFRPCRNLVGAVAAFAAAMAFAGCDRPLPPEQAVAAIEPGTNLLLIIVDTLRLFLRRHRLQGQMLLHPTLMMKRDEDGLLLSVGGEGSVRESCIYLEFYPRVDDERAHVLEAELRQIMGWVENITGDHRRMIRAVREIGASLEFALEHIDGGEERLSKIGRFLDWIVEDQFVLMGTRAYDVQTVEGETEIVMRSEHGLGMWRDLLDSRFHEPQRGEAIPVGLRHSLEDPRIVQVSKGWKVSRSNFRASALRQIQLRRRRPWPTASSGLKT